MRRQKKGFKGKKTHLVVKGKPVPWSKTHEAFRDHLEKQQWAEPIISDDDRQRRQDRPPIRPQRPNEQDFTLADLHAAIAKIKKNRAPGPDGIPAELFTLLDRDGELELLALYNEVWHTTEIPTHWTEATVVSIFKNKGNDTDPANYRPISLLNTTYKLYAAMLQQRLAATSEPHLRATQFGFRAAKGTKNPLFILRRAMEWADMTNHPLHLLFLDWKQAFDSLDHTAMIEALCRFGVSDKMLANIMTIYDSPTFITKGLDDHTATGKVSSGIRQGCPLSPYLFVIVLTVIFHDLDADLLQTGVPCNTWSPQWPTYDLEYADDTLLMARTIPQMQSFLTGIERIAKEYGMHLNSDKTEALTHPNHPDPQLQFLDGESVKTTPQVKYLGSMISWRKTFEAAFKHRAALAEESFKKLRLVWNSSLRRPTKVRIFQSIFIPILIYGLDHLTLTDKQLKRIDAYYYRFLRRSIGIKASYYSRISNNTVWEQALKPHRPSERLHKAQHKVMKEVYNAPMEDPMHSVVFASCHKDRILYQGRRRGMQFPYWIEVTAKRYYPGLLDHNARNPHELYLKISRELRKPNLETAPKCARSRARTRP